MKRLLIIALFTTILVFPIGLHSTDIPAGNVSGTWTIDQSPYNILGSITVPPDLILTINPGVQVVFNGHYGITVEGKLIAQGTDNDSGRIFFTSSRNSSWGGISFIKNSGDDAVSSGSILEYAVVENVSDRTAILAIRADDLTIRGCDILNNTVIGPSLDVLTVTLMVSICQNFTFESNTISGNSGGRDVSMIYLSNCGTVSFVSNIITENYINFSAPNGNPSTNMISIRGSDNITFSDNTITENEVRVFTTLPSEKTSVLRFYMCQNATLDENTITDNYAAVIVSLNSFTDSLTEDIIFNSNVICHNTSYTSTLFVFHYPHSSTSRPYGQGFYMLGSNTISDNTLLSNNATASVTLVGEFIQLISNTISSNIGGRMGGGLYTFVRRDSLIVEDNTIRHNSADWGGGVFIESDISESFLSFTNNNIYQNTAINDGGGVCVYSPYTLAKIDISNNNIYLNVAERGGGLFVYGNNVLTSGNFDSLDTRTLFSKNAITHNTANLGAGVYVSNGDIAMVNNVIAYNTATVVSPGGIYISRDSYINRALKTVLINNIIWRNKGYQIKENTITSIDTLYIRDSIIDGGLNNIWFLGIKNFVGLFSADPLFIDPHLHDWHIQNVDYATIYPGFGDPFEDYVGLFPYDLDSVPPTHTRYFTQGWQWISFPIMERNEDTDESVEFNDVALSFSNTARVFQDQVRSSIFDVDNQAWDYLLDPVKSTKGYKVEVIEDINHSIQGTTLNPNTEITLEPDIENWIGYFLPETQYVSKAFDIETLRKIEYIMTKNGTFFGLMPPMNYDPVTDYGYPILFTDNQHRYTAPYHQYYVLYASKLTVRFGDMVIVKLKENQDPVTVNWSRGSGIAPLYRQPTTHFTYAEKAFYQSVFVEYESEAPPTEIGALINGICKGATVYQGNMSEILLYLDDKDLGQEIEIIFAYNKGGIFSTQKMTKFNTVNPSSWKLVYQPLIATANTQYYHIVVYDGKNGAPENIAPPFVQLLQNYPNPFNPDTKIDFYLSHDDHVTLSVYNIKGQKVCDLLHGATPAGKHSVVWNGVDSMGHTVSSGVYLYKLTTRLGSVQRKMVLLK